ncbi:hypothetical protein Y032_0012g1618 [Ancylostoma ceylanicum]|uniref:Uncharacterized protein n=1 Tax=Ancylostoma ceylanicum TaxID=53326 RepID=A0A016VE10_9BILA|nr:hypothetical protein Y032_0012g1618 [Ancylostoma ceylanicum]
MTMLEGGGNDFSQISFIFSSGRQGLMSRRMYELIPAIHESRISPYFYAKMKHLPRITEYGIPAQQR